MLGGEHHPSPAEVSRARAGSSEVDPDDGTHRRHERGSGFTGGARFVTFYDIVSGGGPEAAVRRRNADYKYALVATRSRSPAEGGALALCLPASGGMAHSDWEWGPCRAN